MRHCVRPIRFVFTIATSGFASYISANKDKNLSAADPFAQTVSVLIPCDWRLRDYSESVNAIPYNSDNFRAYASVHSYGETWKTTASLLRVGDVVSLYWCRGGWNTEAMKSAIPTFYGDALYMEVQRGKQRLTFLVDACICEDNLARMIRRA